MSDLSYVIGSDIGGGSARVAAVSSSGSILRKITISSDPAGGYKALVRRVRGAVDQIAESEKREPMAMCVACAGAVDFEKGVITRSPNFPGWVDVPLAGDIGRGRAYPAILENDANAAAVGEGWIGAARGWSDFAMLTLGTGVGGGIVLAGKLFRGDNGMAGEVGHLPVSMDKKVCGCGRTGCLETTASAGGVARLAREIYHTPEGAGLRKASRGSLDKVDARMTAELAEKGDEACARIMRRAGVELGEALGVLTLSMGLSRFVIGGGMAGALNLLTKPMRKAALARAYTLQPRRLKIAKAALGDDAGLLGAARLALDLAGSTAL